MSKDLGVKPYIFPQPVLIVASYDANGNPDAMNVAYGGVVNSNRIQINIGVRHKTSDNIKIKKAFTVAIADAPHEMEADYLGCISGKEEPDKIKKAGLHVEKSKNVDAPIITDFPLSLECKVEEINEYGKTLRIVAEIVNVVADESVLGRDYKVDLKKLNPLCFDVSNVAYVTLGDFAGHAFSDGNKLK